MTDIQLFKGYDSTLSADPETMRQVYRRFVAPLAPKSRETIHYALCRVAEGLGINSLDADIETLPWHQVTADVFSDLMLSWRGQLEAPTIRLYMYALRGITRACYVSGLMPAHQFMLIKEVKFPRGRNRVGRGRSVERDYVDAIFENCRNDERIQGLRDAALFAVIFGTGMRRGEAASIDDEAINLDQAEIQVRVKGNNWDTKHIQAWAITHIHEWRQVRRSEGLHNGPFFTRVLKSGKITSTRLTGRGILYLLEERSKMTGLPFLIRPHDGRRTLGTNMIEEHGELVAQRVLGHADLSTTRIYDKRSDAFIKKLFRDKK